MDKQRTHYLVLALLSVASILVSFKVLATTKHDFTPAHSTVYHLKKFGTHVGTITNQLAYENNKTHYLSKAEPAGFAALFVRDEINEKSTLYFPALNTVVPAGLPQQLSYSLDNSRKPRKNQNIVFDWLNAHTAEITGAYKGREYNLTTDEATWSRQVLPLLMSTLLKNDNELKQYTFKVTQKGKIEKYTYTYESTEQLNFNNEKYSSLKFKVQKPGSRRTSYVWLSKTQLYLPLKIEQYKDGKLDASMYLTQFKLQP